MAFDPQNSSSSRALSEGTLVVLRVAVLGHPHADPTPEEALERAIEAVVSEARAQEMRAEELILAFKALYNSLPAPASAGARAERLRLRDRLVTACIKAYYAHGAANGGTAGPSA